MMKYTKVNELKENHVYADFMGSTPICEEALQTYIEYSREYYANPSGLGDACINSSIELGILTDWFCKMFDCEYVIFTSGATEANNIVIRTFGNNRKDKENKGLGEKGIIVAGNTEHSSVLECVQQVNGLVLCNDNEFIDRIDRLTNYYQHSILVSCMSVNNETGDINKAVSQVAEYAKNSSDLYLHVDAAQSAGKIQLKLKEQNIDYATISGHKMHGPKGVGALLIRDSDALSMLSRYSFGGNQQKLISGTINLPSIAAMKSAYEVCIDKFDGSFSRPAASLSHPTQRWNRWLRELLYQKFKENLVIISQTSSAPWCLAFSIRGVDSDEVVLGCRSTISNGSACKGVVQKSHVYKALGLDEEVLDGALRVSYSPLTYSDPIEHANLLTNDIINTVEKIYGF